MYILVECIKELNGMKWRCGKKGFKRKCTFIFPVCVARARVCVYVFFLSVLVWSTCVIYYNKLRLCSVCCFQLVENFLEIVPQRFIALLPWWCSKRLEKTMLKTVKFTKKYGLVNRKHVIYRRWCSLLNFKLHTKREQNCFRRQTSKIAGDALVLEREKDMKKLSEIFW